MPERETRSRARSALEGAGLSLAVAAVVGLLMLTGVFEPLELWAADAWQRVLADPAGADPDIVLVAIDQGSLETFKQKQGLSYPWPREVFALVLEFLARGQPKAVLFDILLEEAEDDREEVDGQASDARFAAAVAGFGRVTLGVRLRPPDMTPVSAQSQALLSRMALPLPAAHRLPAYVRLDPLAPLVAATDSAFGFTNAAVDGDGLVRRAELLAQVGERVVPSLALAAWRQSQPDFGLQLTPEGLLLAAGTVPLDAEGRAWIRYHGPGGAGAGSGRTYRYLPILNLVISALALEEGRTPPLVPEFFRDKWVIIGSAAAELFDLKATPFSTTGRYPGMEIHATVLDNLLHGDFLRRAPRTWGLLLVLLACLLVGVVGRLGRRLRWGALSTMGALVLFGGLAAAALQLGGWVLDQVAVGAGILGSLIAVASANNVSERRSRRLIRDIFQHYLDPSVVRRLLDAPQQLKLGGEARNCTVFFADIAGFTALAERLPPAQLVELINRVLTELAEAVVHHGGFVDKFIGDAVMAVFGAPADMPDHPAAACRAALDCLRRIAELRTAPDCPLAAELAIRLGLNTGEVIVGNMGSSRRMNYTVMGDAVNLASRLEGANKEYGTTILVGPQTRSRAGAELCFRPMDRLRVKGKQEPVQIFELLGPPAALAGEVAARLDLFERALELYNQRRWDEALTLFGQCQALGDDPPSRLYIERCRAFLAKPPPPDWDGVTVLTAK